MLRRLKNRKGFSLVELIIVIVILGVLVGIAVPNLIGYVKKSRIAADIENADVILTNVNLVYAEMTANGVEFTAVDKPFLEKVVALIQGGTLNAGGTAIATPAPKAVNGVKEFTINAIEDTATGEYTFTVSAGKDADDKDNIAAPDTSRAGVYAK